MCGIAGVLTSRHEVPLDQVMDSMQRAMHHRGPDDGDSEVIDLPGGVRLGLAHRRLSVLDLSSAGRQPMVDRASGCRIVFNGEIYNYKRLRQELARKGVCFQSEADTEVLLAGLANHGEAFLDRLEGMFAFAFYDPRVERLLLARDPAGIKPLYVAESPGGFLFASETRTLLQSGLIRPKVDRAGLAGFLAYGAVQHPATIFEGIRSIPPGTCETWNTGGGLSSGQQLRRFWSFPSIEKSWTSRTAIEATRNAIEAAVADHLVADVPVGVFLSSGIDSTVIAAIAAKHAPDVRSFTIVFEDHIDFNEQRLATETAREFGLEHVAIPLPESSAQSAVSDWLAAMDQPSIDGLNTYMISRAVRERGIKVALSGLGADELFGGYPSFRDAPRIQRWSRLVGRLPRSVRHGFTDVVTIGRPASTRLKMRDAFSGICSLRSACLRRRRLLSDQQLNRLGLGRSSLELDHDYLDLRALDDVDQHETDAVRVVSQVESRSYQGNMLLRDADVNGMAFGLEIRVPFLDRRLLDLVHAMPDRVRLPPGSPGKPLLRKASSDLLREEILTQPKRGFTLPLQRWMCGALRSSCEQEVSVLCDSRVVDADEVRAVWNSYLNQPESPIWSRAFALVVLGAFLRKAGAIG